MAEVPTWYVMERVARPEHEVMSILGRIVRITTIEAATDGHLRVDGVWHHGPGTVRALRGRLVWGRLPWQRTAVELELAPWSATESMIGLRPVRRVPRDGSSARYFDAAWLVVRRVVDHLGCDRRTARDDAFSETLREAS